MAIDTALKRGSAVDVGIPFRAFLSFPDSSIGQADRQVEARLYSGILASVTAAAGVFQDLTTLFSHYAWDTLRDANPTKVDTNTLIHVDEPNVIAGSHSPDDRNTAYEEFLN